MAPMSELRHFQIRDIHRSQRRWNFGCYSPVLRLFKGNLVQANEIIDMGYVWPEKRLGGDTNGAEVFWSCATGFDSWFFFVKFLPFYGADIREI